MRLKNFRDEICIPTLIDNYRKCVDVCEYLSGSWEVWLQVMLALEVRKRWNSKRTEFIREAQYPGTRLYCDFNIATGSQNDENIWCELKVLLKNTGSKNRPKELATRFLGDVEKIKTVHASTGDTVGAIAVSPKDSEEFISELVEQIGFLMASDPSLNLDYDQFEFLEYKDDTHGDDRKPKKLKEKDKDIKIDKKKSVVVFYLIQ